MITVLMKFSRQLKGIGNKGDILYATSTSGKSKNVIKAIEEAKKIGIITISVTGKNSTTIRNSRSSNKSFK